MKKLSDEEFSKLALIGSGKTSPFYKKIIGLHAGESLFISKEEWRGCQTPTRICRYIMKTGTAASPGIYPKSQNPDVRTKTITGQKDTLRGEIESLIRDIYADIPDSWLSPSDREILNIHLHDREPSPHPQIVDPIIGLTNKSGGDVELRVRTTTDSTNASKPLDHVLVQTQYTLTAANDPAPPFEQCLQHYESSHALSMMHLGISNVGKRFYG